MSLDPTNPFVSPSPLPFELPDYVAISDADYQPAIEAGMAEHLAELAALAADPEPADVANVIEAWESSGRLLSRALSAFFTKQPADTNDVLDAVEEAVAPQLAAHGDAIHLDRRLYDRVAALARRVEAGEVELDPASAYWLERKLLAFERNGVNLAEAEQARLRELNHRIAELQSAFGREALAGLNAGAVLVDDEAELDGLSAAEISGARDRAVERGHDTGWLIELDNTSGQRPLDVLRNRELRRRLHLASVSRGWGGEHDTRGLVVELARLRAERALLLGFPHHAAYVAADACARTGEAVWDLLTRLAPPAVANARAEAAEMEEVWRRIEPDAPLAAWDWQYVAELVRTERYSLDASLLRPYLELERVLHDGVFAAANGLYGITFTERADLVGYNDEVRVFEVNDTDGTPIGLFAADFYTRPGKQGGAWMNNMVDQNHLLGQLPVVMNNSNLVKPPAGEPTLMTWDDVITLFHEFGHALHGLLSDTRYASQSGTETPRDFVEYPSQVNEMWALDEQILPRYAVHHASGEPIPAAWVQTLRSSTLFQQGFKTTEYLGAALLDQVWHRTPLDELPSDPEQVEAFEHAALASVGLDYDLVPPRYRTTYFRHTFEGGYDAGYYSYIWSEVLDADTAAFMTANGGLTRENGERFRRHLLAKGGSVDAMDSFRDYRGQDPDLVHLLRRRGLEV
ncbi:M3 family metallopeptidase [Propionicimonas sp.]|uniref:M3 family metallopeptidase n=1 Tax=Propionicimonas sp. TaxID=1955623 RepID=UPI0039E4D75B